MLDLGEVQKSIAVLKATIPADDRCGVLRYLVEMADREASDLKKRLSQEQRAAAEAGYQRAAGH